MQILFTFENPLPNDAADAEVFVSTAKHLAPLASRAWLHVPVRGESGRSAAAALAGMPAISAFAPMRPAALRHVFSGFTIVSRRAFREADLVYTRNLWVAWLSVRFGQRVVFDHYRPWPTQIPPLQRWIYRLMCHRLFVVNICHSEYTRSRYLELGIPAAKLRCVRTGFEPRSAQAPNPLQVVEAPVPGSRHAKTVVYTGRVNRKKGLDVVIDAARALPDHEFILIGSSGDGPIEALAKSVANVRILPWQTPEAFVNYLAAADVLLIPPSRKPLTVFGSTVLPLKVFSYLAAGRPIVAGDTPDLREVLKHGENAFLCRPDCPDALVTAIRTVTGDAQLATRLAATALANSREFTWSKRAEQIAAIITERLQSTNADPGAWNRTRRRTWRRQSWRWIVHLVRKRSWVLPVDPAGTNAAWPSERE